MLTNSVQWRRMVAALCVTAGMLTAFSTAEACHRGGGYYGGYRQSAYYAQPVYVSPRYVVPAYSPVVYPVQVVASSPAQPSTASLVAQAKQMLKARDYAVAQQAITVALQREPKNAALLQLKSLISFAQSDYQQSAATAYAALTLGRAFDWNVIRQLYPSPAEYTEQYHQLAAVAKEKPEHAQLQFLLAYHHLVLGHQHEGRMALQQAQKSLPQDKLIPMLLSQLPKEAPTEDVPVSASLLADDLAPLPK